MDVAVMETFVFFDNTRINSCSDTLATLDKSMIELGMLIPIILAMYIAAVFLTWFGN